MASSLKSRLAANLRKIKPGLVVRLFFVALFLLPGFALAMAKSWPKMTRWRRRETCLRFVESHPDAFAGVDASSLEVRPLRGGVSNSNQVWRFRSHTGQIVDYFVKVYLPVGSYWAENLCRLSPFPRVPMGTIAQRFRADRRSRRALAARLVAVPRVVAFDAAENVLVTEFVDGVNVDDALKAAAARGWFTPTDEEMIRRCGSELAKTHEAGFSLVDTQPVNCLWAERDLTVYFTDLEFTTRDDRRHWDAGFFLTFLLLRLPEPMKAPAAELFLENYRRVRPLAPTELESATHDLADYVPLMEMILDARQFTPEELVQELVR